jgi:hypothetical protein
VGSAHRRHPGDRGRAPSRWAPSRRRRLSTGKGGSGVRVESTNSHASDFTSNLVVVRAEVRRALAVRQPLGICKVTLDWTP